jgi:uncharacterized protein YjbI with pentapeptide repeats
MKPKTDAQKIGNAEASLAAKAIDLEALLQVVADAAKVGSSLWLSYLFLLFFLLVAVGSVTHRDLFLENPVALPFLSVSLPLVAFFMVGPALFLVAHAYVLLHFVLLSDKVGAFHVQLQAQIKNETTRMQLRRQLPSDIFAQSFAGPRDIREGTIGAMLKLIAWISLVVGPLLLLILFQFQFLAYHHWAATWWHRIAVVIDLLLLWRLWPSIVRGKIAAPNWSQIMHAWGPMAASLASVLLVFTVATYPGEILNRLPSLPVIRWTCNPIVSKWLSLHDLLVGGGCETRTPTSLWPNRLVLINFEPPRRPSEGEASGTPAAARLDLSERNLEGAVMIGSNLRKANMTSANLRGARFTEVQMQGATLTTANLAGASFFDVKLQETTLSGATLQGASFALVNFAGALFSGTRLQGASLDNAILRGASLQGAQLQGASLKNARLEGAVLDGSQLQGAILEGAFLDGASLRGTQLQGATFTAASLFSTDLNRAFLWRASGGDTRSIIGAVSDGGNWLPQYQVQTQHGLSEEMPWTAEAYQSLREMLQREVPDGSLKERALQSVEVLACAKDPCNFSDSATPAMQEFKRAIDQAQVDRDAYLVALAKTLGDEICAAPEIEALIGMMNNGRIRWAVQGSSALIDRIVGPTCPAGKILTPTQRAELEALRAR